MELSEKKIKDFNDYLIEEEKSKSTLENYIRSIRNFKIWLCGQSVNKTLVLSYKNYLIEKYKTSTINGILSALNSFFEFCGCDNLRVKTLKQQKEIFCNKEKELSKIEYIRLLETAMCRKNKRLYYIMQTICSSGIRISELSYITVKAVKNKYAEVRCKGKNRVVILSNELCELLSQYIKSKKIKNGSVFVTRTGKPVDRSNIWREMKKLSASAQVCKTKIFPHNFRHLFARTYYSLQKDIVRLADILGHSSINTTRIYTTESGEVHRRQIQKMGLVVLNV